MLLAKQKSGACLQPLKSIRNLQICTEVGLVEKVLGKIEKVDNMIAGMTFYNTVVVRK